MLGRANKEIDLKHAILLRHASLWALKYLQDWSLMRIL